ncbi:MAG: tetratricopeptide repeat protein [Polyangiaceae bacterium]|nr:tetratricopeptide repeat protein [Polyangiaceae bacterium]
MRSSLVALAVVAAPVLASTAAGAQPARGKPPATAHGGPAATSDRDAEAKALFQAGRAAYEAGRFEDALGHFQRAYELSGRSALLYNVGLAADRARKDDVAIQAYERFLAAEPESSLRGEVEARLGLLKRARDERERPARPRASRPAPADPAPEDGGSRGWMPWAVAGGGAAFVVTGGVLLTLGLSARSRVVDARDGARWSELASDADAAPLLLGGGAALLVGGVAAAVGGVVWATRKESGAETALVVGPGAFLVRGRF